MWALEKPAQTGHREGCQLQLPWGHPLPRGTAQIYLPWDTLGGKELRKQWGCRRDLLRAEAPSQLGDNAIRTPGRVGEWDRHPSPGASPAPPSVATLPGGDLVALMKAS